MGPPPQSLMASRPSGTANPPVPSLGPGCSQWGQGTCQQASRELLETQTRTGPVPDLVTQNLSVNINVREAALAGPLPKKGLVPTCLPT